MKMILKLLFCLGLMISLNSTYVWADTVYLNDGRVISGPIIEDTNEYIIIQDGRVATKLYRERIQRIEKASQVSDLNGIPIDQSKFSGISTKKLDLIDRYTKLSGMQSSLSLGISQVISKSPIEKQAALEQAFDISEIMEELVPIYDRNFTESELMELVTFFESPAGQKMTSVAPILMKESMEISIKYFMKKSKGL